MMSQDLLLPHMRYCTSSEMSGLWLSRFDKGMLAIRKGLGCVETLLNLS